MRQRAFPKSEMEECFAQWAAVCALKSSAPHLFIETESFRRLCESTLKLIRRKRFVSDTFFVVFVNGLRGLLGCDFPDHSQAVYFLFEVIISSELYVSERALLIQSTKNFIPPITMFCYVKIDMIRSICLLMDTVDPDVDEVARLLQVLEIVISGVMDKSTVLFLVYASYSDLEKAGPEYFDNLDLSPAYVGSLINRKRDRDKTAKDSTISAFISLQVVSSCPVCRRYAYRILGLIATRCFDTVGEKVVGHLLLKKRHQEVPENRLTITIILWNLMFIWPEYLTHILLFPDFVTPHFGKSAAVGSDSLLIDLWDDSDSVPSGGNRKSASDRAASILSIARIIVAKRLASQQMNKLVVREVILSFQSRSTVAIMIGNSVAETRQKQISNDIPISKKKKQKKDVEDRILSSSSITVSDMEVSGSAEEDFMFKSSILNITDEDDYAVLRELVSGVSGNTVLDRSARMEVLVESLSAILGFSVKASVVKTVRRDTFARSDATSQRESSTINAGGHSDVNMMFFKGTVALYSSMIRQMFLCRNEMEVIDFSMCGSPAFKMWYENQETAWDEATVDSLYEVFSICLDH